MVVAVGLTVTPTPLVAVRLPGVITPVPFAKTPVKVALDPSVIKLSFAVKLVIEGGGGGGVLDDPLPQAVKLAKATMRMMDGGTTVRRRFMGSTVVWEFAENLRTSGAKALKIFLGARVARVKLVPFPSPRDAWSGQA